ncbi:hypothetical protein CBL_01569 [Carabus blaptoides fortunei]
MFLKGNSPLTSSKSWEHWVVPKEEPAYPSLSALCKARISSLTEAKGFTELNSNQSVGCLERNVQRITNCVICHSPVTFNRIFPMATNQTPYSKFVNRSGNGAYHTTVMSIILAEHKSPQHKSPCGMCDVSCQPNENADRRTGHRETAITAHHQDPEKDFCNK